MTAFSFRTSALFQAIQTVAVERSIEGGFGAQVDGLCQTNGGDVTAAQASFVGVLRAIADKSAEYGTAKGRAEAEAYRAHADAIEAVSVDGDDAPVAAGFVALVEVGGEVPVVVAFEGFESQSRRVGEAMATDLGITADVKVVRVECYAHRWSFDERDAVLFGDPSPAGEIAMPYGYRPHA